MQTYQIADLEQISGIKAHTIRIWEKRYGLIEPHRTKTNIRYYDNEQARKLLNIATLLEAGHKISKLSVLSDDELSGLLALSSKSENLDTFCISSINALVASALAYDESNFEKTYSSALNRLGLYNTMLQVIYPFLYRIGILWTIGDSMPAQEHFASGLIKRKLMAAIDGITISPTKKSKFVLFLPENEWHEIGLYFSEYILRSNGFKVFNLGQNVPLDNVVNVISDTGSEIAISFFIARKSSEEIDATIKTLLDSNKDLKVLVGSSEINKNALPVHKRLIQLQHPEDLLKFIK